MTNFKNQNSPSKLLIGFAIAIAAVGLILFCAVVTGTFQNI